MSSEPLRLDSQAALKPDATIENPVGATKSPDHSQETELVDDDMQHEELDLEDDELETEDESSASDGSPGKPRIIKRKRRQSKNSAVELRLLGRRSLCKRIPDIAPLMFSLVKRRVLSSYSDELRGLDEEQVTDLIKKYAGKLTDRNRILEALKLPDDNFDRGQLQEVILNILIQEETHSIDENRLYEKVNDFEKYLVKAAKSFDFDELKKQDPDRWHHFDTYRIVLDAAWSDDDAISPDEARLLAVLRGHLNISMEDHWQISALLKRFPKAKCMLHTPDEINEARKELQRNCLLWSYKDDENRNVDIIPFEVASIIRKEHLRKELQRANYRRLMSHDYIILGEVREVLQKHGLNRYGNKSELIERVVQSDILPSEVLGYLDREKLSSICSGFGLKAYAAKAELIVSIIDFYDDLTFEERTSKDEREVWYSNYELLANRLHAELRAKKVITKDLEIEYQFEGATSFLFERKLHVMCDCSRKENKADGRLPLENNQTILYDCKSVEGSVNLQDHLESQFEGYLRRELENGKQPLAFLVIGPSFTPQSIKLAYQFKAKSNWDVALITAEGLKHLAERWSATVPEKPFPIRLLNRTEVIDKERAEFLLSLA